MVSKRCWSVMIRMMFGRLSAHTSRLLSGCHDAAAGAQYFLLFVDAETFILVVTHIASRQVNGLLFSQQTLGDFCLHRPGETRWRACLGVGEGRARVTGIAAEEEQLVGRCCMDKAAHKLH